MTELQAIVSIIKSVGASGQTMFIWYMVGSILISAMKYLTFIIAFVILKGIITYIIHVVTGVHKLRDAAGIGSRGEITNLELRKMGRMLEKQSEKEERNGRTD